LNPDRRIILIATCLAILIISFMLLSGEEEIITDPKKMSTPQLIQDLEDEETRPRADVARELLRRQPQILKEKDRVVYTRTVSAIKQGLANPSPETKQASLNTLISYPELQKEFTPQNSKDIENLKKTVQALNKKLGNERYRIIQIGDQLQIRTKFVLRPVKVQLDQ
jgi:hypothetical protein